MKYYINYLIFLIVLLRADAGIAERDGEMLLRFSPAMTAEVRRDVGVSADVNDAVIKEAVLNYLEVSEISTLPVGTKAPIVVVKPLGNEVNNARVRELKERGWIQKAERNYRYKVADFRAQNLSADSLNALANTLANTRDDRPAAAQETTGATAGTTTGATTGANAVAMDAPATVMPNDLASDQWGMNNTGQTGGVADVDINAPEAWVTTTGNSDVLVGVVDTGIDYDHPDLVGNLWTNTGEIPANGVDDDGNGYIDDVHGWNSEADNGNADDDFGHGTAVAGVIGAQGNNGFGIAGVNWQVSLVSMKFISSSGYGYLVDAIEAIDYAIMLRTVKGLNIRVLNNSWGGADFSSFLQEAIHRAEEAGILFVVAAGNGSNDGTGDDNDAVLFYPASIDEDNLLAVAAIVSSGSKVAWSNYGVRSVALAAPGVDIMTTGMGGSYFSGSGTSMATPFVSGVAALALAVHPEVDLPNLKSMLVSTATFSSVLADKVAARGYLNAHAALTAYDFPPVPQAIAPQTLATYPFSSEVLLGAQDPENDALSWSALMVEESAEAYRYDVERDFIFPAYDWQGICGFQEKYLQDASGRWYYMLPSGALYEAHEDEDQCTTATLLFQAPALYYRYLDLLTTPASRSSISSGAFSALGYVPQVTVVASDAGHNLQVATQQRFVGSFAVLATVTGNGKSSDMVVRYSVENQAPQLESLSDVVTAHGAQDMAIPLMAVDVDRDDLTVVANIEAISPPSVGILPTVSATLQRSADTAFAGQLSVTGNRAFSGAARITVKVSDGITEVERAFLYTVSNSAPTLAIPTIGLMERGGVEREYQLNLTDTDGDELVTTVAIGTPVDLATEVRDTLQLRAYSNYLLNYLKLGDKWFKSGVDQGDYYLLPNGDLYRFAGSVGKSPLVYNLGSSYYTYPERLTFGGGQSIGQSLLTSEVAPSARIEGTRLYLNPGNGGALRFELTVSASDGVATATSAVGVSLTATAEQVAGRDSDGDGHLDLSEQSNNEWPNGDRLYEAASNPDADGGALYGLWGRGKPVGKYLQLPTAEVLELANLGKTPNRVRVSLLFPEGVAATAGSSSKDGVKSSSSSVNLYGVTLDPLQVLHLSLGDLVGKAVGKYGSSMNAVIRVEHSKPLKAQIASYPDRSENSESDTADRDGASTTSPPVLITPLERAVHARSGAVLVSDGGAKGIVEDGYIVSLVNLAGASNTIEVGTTDIERSINSGSSSGGEAGLVRKVFTLKPWERRDLRYERLFGKRKGGAVFFKSLSPNISSRKYLALLSFHNYCARAGGFNYCTRDFHGSSIPTGNELQLVNEGGSESGSGLASRIYLSNHLPKELVANVRMYNSDGQRIHSRTVKLAGYQMLSYRLPKIKSGVRSGATSGVNQRIALRGSLAAGGLIRVTSNAGNSLVAKLVVERKNGDTERFHSEMTGASDVGAAENVLYNTYLGQGNLLTLVNGSQQRNQITLRSGKMRRSFALSSHSSQTVDLRDILPPDSYGQLEVRGGGNVLGRVVRW